jgi:hypothetical protein
LTRAQKIAGAFFFAFGVAACHSTSSSDAQGSASAAPTVSSWPILPADPVDAMAAADADPAVVAYERRANNDLNPKFRVCIDHELTKSPKLQGSVTMVVSIHADGSVASAHPTQLQGFNAEVVKCFTHWIEGSHFRPTPTNADLQINVPINLTSG